MKKKKGKIKVYSLYMNYFITDKDMPEPYELEAIFSHVVEAEEYVDKSDKNFNIDRDLLDESSYSWEGDDYDVFTFDYKQLIKQLSYMKEFEVKLSDITENIREQQKMALELLKDYIRENGPMLMDYDDPVETTFFDENYVVEEVKEVYLDDKGYLVWRSTSGLNHERFGGFSNDTIIDILKSATRMNNEE